MYDFFNSIFRNKFEGVFLVYDIFLDFFERHFIFLTFIEKEKEYGTAKQVRIQAIGRRTKEKIVVDLEHEGDFYKDEESKTFVPFLEISCDKSISFASFLVMGCWGFGGWGLWGL